MFYSQPPVEGCQRVDRKQDSGWEKTGVADCFEAEAFLSAVFGAFCDQGWGVGDKGSVVKVLGLGFRV